MNNYYDKIYYLTLPGTTQPNGPFSEQELIGFYNNHQIPYGSMVWAQRWEDWKPLELVFNWTYTHSQPVQPQPKMPMPAPGPETQPPVTPGTTPMGYYPTNPTPGVPIYPRQQEPQVTAVRLNFWELTKRAMKTRKTSGRATRMEYWAAHLACLIFCYISGLIAILVVLPVLNSDNDLGKLVNIIVFAGYFYLIVAPTLLCCVRRVHDLGWHGAVSTPLVLLEFLFYFKLYYASLLGYVPVDGIDLLCNLLTFVLCLVVGCIDSQRKTNKYGPSEKYPS